MTPADRRAQTSRYGRPVPRAMRPSGRCAGRGRAGRASGARRRGRFSRMAPRPSGSRPTARSSGEASVLAASSTGVPACPTPSTVAPPSRHSATVSSSLDICSPTFRRCFPIRLRHGAESGRTANGMTGYAVEFHIPTEHFMSSLTKVFSNYEGEAQGLDTPARAWRLAVRNRSGRIQNGALRRLGDGAVAGALDLPGRCPARRR